MEWLRWTRGWRSSSGKETLTKHALAVSPKNHFPKPGWRAEREVGWSELQEKFKTHMSLT